MSVLYRTDIPYTIRPARSSDCRFVYDLSQDPTKPLVEIRNVQLEAAIPDSAFQLPDGVQVMDMGNMFPMGQR